MLKVVQTRFVREFMEVTMCNCGGRRNTTTSNQLGNETRTEQPAQSDVNAANTAVTNSRSR